MGYKSYWPKNFLVELPYILISQIGRQDVRPGITRWVQVNGRNAISWEEKFKLDVWYLDNVSFKIDLEILLLSILNIIKQECISSLTSVRIK